MTVRDERVMDPRQTRYDFDVGPFTVQVYLPEPRAWRVCWWIATVEASETDEKLAGILRRAPLGTRPAPRTADVIVAGYRLTQIARSAAFRSDLAGAIASLAGS